VAVTRGFLLDDDLVGASGNLASNVDHGGPFLVVEWADDPVIDIGQHGSGLVRNIGRFIGRSVLEAHSKWHLTHLALSLLPQQLRNPLDRFFPALVLLAAEDFETFPDIQLELVPRRP
jgi:hypothetical protein